MAIPDRKYLLLAHCTRLALSTLLLASTAVADASNLNFLNDTPISYMKKHDMESIKIALVEVLNTREDGETGRWTNGRIGNSVLIEATMKPEITTHEMGKACRRVSIVLMAKGQSMELHPVFCATGQRDWTMKKQ